MPPPLQIGDLIVHIDHGIGQYNGLKIRKINEIEYEFIEENQDRKDDLNLLTLLRKFISKKLRK